MWVELSIQNCINSNIHPWFQLEYPLRKEGEWALIRVVFNGYIVYHDHGFYFTIRGVGAYWNMGVY